MLFWDITQHTKLIPYQRFKTTYRSHLHGSRNPRIILYLIQYIFLYNEKSRKFSIFHALLLSVFSDAYYFKSHKSVML